MEKFLNPALWPLWIVVLVWLYRGRMALNTLLHLPVVRPKRDQVPLKGPGPFSFFPMVSIIVPARNEEKNIGLCVESLLAQDYPNFEVIVVDDRSTDSTASVLNSILTRHPERSEGSRDPSATLRPQDDKAERLKIINVKNLPPGWVGKTHAVHTGMQHAKGEWLLFTDADTRHEPESVSAVVAHARSRGLRFLSLLPRCLTNGLIEDIIQPSAMVFLGLWFPIQKINDPHSSVYFANGQYLLMERKLYEEIEGHAKVKEEFLEDFALMKNAKQTGARTECALGAEIYGTRMYDSFPAMWRGWRRIYLHAFRKNPAALFLKFSSVALFSVVPFAAFLPLTFLARQNPERYAFLWQASIPLLIYILILCWKAYGIVKAKRLFAVLHPLAAFLIAMILLDASWMAATKQPTQWR